MKIVERIIDALTGEETVIEREETVEEVKIREKREAEYAKAQAEATAKATTRQALLNKLGITEDEARLLLGGN